MSAYTIIHIRPTAGHKSFLRMIGLGPLFPREPGCISQETSFFTQRISSGNKWTKRFYYFYSQTNAFPVTNPRTSLMETEPNFLTKLVYFVCRYLYSYTHICEPVIYIPLVVIIVSPQDIGVASATIRVSAHSRLKLRTKGCSMAWLNYISIWNILKLGTKYQSTFSCL